MTLPGTAGRPAPPRPRPATSRAARAWRTCRSQFGPATPALESRQDNAQAGRYGLLRLTQRAGGAHLPKFIRLDVKSMPLDATFPPAATGHRRYPGGRPAGPGAPQPPAASSDPALPTTTAGSANARAATRMTRTRAASCAATTRDSRQRPPMNCPYAASSTCVR